MKKVLFLLSFVLVATNTYSQSEIRLSGDKPKVGDVIHVTVRNSDGPIQEQSVYVLNRDKKPITIETTDKNGKVSLMFSEKGDYIRENRYGYYPIEELISRNHYDILLKSNPDESNPHPRLNATFSNNYPAIIVDGNLLATKDEDWEIIDPTKKEYSKEEIAFFIVADAKEDAKEYSKEIKKIVVHNNDEFTEKLGKIAKNGAIEVIIREETNDNGKEKHSK